MVELGQDAEGVGVGEESPFRVFVHSVDEVFNSHLIGWLCPLLMGVPGPFLLEVVELPLWGSWVGCRWPVSRLYLVCRQSW